MWYLQGCWWLIPLQFISRAPHICVNHGSWGIVEDDNDKGELTKTHTTARWSYYAHMALANRSTINLPRNKEAFNSSVSE
jgi:hypothetical protein